MFKHFLVKFLVSIILAPIFYFVISPTKIFAAPSCNATPPSIFAGGTITTDGSGLAPDINYTYTISIGATLLNFTKKTDSLGSFSDTRIINFPGTANVVLAGSGGPLTCGSVTVDAVPPRKLLTGENPCASGYCNTAIGNSIPTTKEGFTGALLAVATSLAGGIALILMVLGSIKILMAAGDPQKIQNGRDMIVAAVAGLLFLIFSVLILQFLGREFINIPFAIT